MENKLNKIIDSMGRNRSEAIKKVKEYQDRIEEHLWKLFAYHEYRVGDINGWINSLNNYLIVLVRYRIPKKGGKFNFDFDFLYDKLYIEPFGTDSDIESLIKIWSRKGYPIIFVKDKNKLKKLVVKYINSVLENKQFTVNKKELN